MYKKFHGVITALVTPFDIEGKVDLSNYKSIIKEQIDGGVSGLVTCGTTGESPCLSYDEQMILIKTCVSVAQGRVPVIAGVGTNNTDKVCMLAKDAENAGVDALLVIAPYYNKPSQDGIFAHFQKIDQSVNTPIIIYNHPGRTGVDININTLRKLSSLKNVIGIKDASGDPTRPLEIRSQIGEHFVQLLGIDVQQLSFYANGGHGVISVASNVIPTQMQKIYKLIKENNFKDALKEHSRYLDLLNFLECEINPVPVKACLNALGKCRADVRLPLVNLASHNADKIKTVLSELILEDNV
ncbi:MAG: 4-hydroxy-tetrahydrodipicolinate synthase [Alphaproteobacteria bacterium]|nr:4-hydroxy-tetrahydrodipicolinate synthase [Alphaproteobacteria bacterium]